MRARTVIALAIGLAGHAIGGNAQTGTAQPADPAPMAESETDPFSVRDGARSAEGRGDRGPEKSDPERQVLDDGLGRGMELRSERFYHPKSSRRGQLDDRLHRRK